MIVEKKPDWKYNSKPNEDTEESPNYLDIWRVNPAFKDTNPYRCIFQTILLCVLLAIIYILTYSIFLNSYIALGIALFTLIISVKVFSDTLFFTLNSHSQKNNNHIAIDPFDNFAFWMLEQDPKTVLILNKKDAITIALRMFKVKTLPENVYPTINHFLKAIYSANLQFLYQVIQNPKINLSEHQHQKYDNKTRKEYTKLKTMKSFETSIYFSVFTDVKGVLNRARIERLIETVENYSHTFESHLSSNFHHTKVKILEGKELVNGIRTFFTQHSVKTYREPKDMPQAKKNRSRSILKLSFVSFSIIYISILFAFLNISFLVIIIVDLIIFLLTIFLIWREIFTYLSNSTLKNTEGAILFDPFYDVEFYRLKQWRDTLFMYIDKQLLLALKMVNLRNAIQPSDCYLDKVFRELIKHKIAFTYSLYSTPATDPRSFKEYTKGLKAQNRNYLLN